MPSALSGQDDYYTRQHHRQPSMSQSSLPDQSQESSVRAQSPGRSAALLPATTYGQPAFKQSQSFTAPDASTLLSSSKIGGLDDAVKVTQDLNDSHHTIYQTQHVDVGVTTGRSALRVDTNEQLLPSSTYSLPAAGRGSAGSNGVENSNPQALLSGLRGRKSSVKNLVAQINASSGEEPPPLPTSHISQPGSRNISPVVTSAVPFSRNTSRQVSAPSDFSESSLQPEHSYTISQEHYGLGLHHGNQALGDTSYPRKPLFGEVVSKLPSISIPGFGIQYARPRSGSEGSPLVGNGPGFPRMSDHTRQQSDHSTPTMNDSVIFEDSFSNANTTPRPGHRRLTDNDTTSSTTELAALRSQAHSSSEPPVAGPDRRKQSFSRIPISAHRASFSPNSGGPSSSTSTSLSEARLKAATPKRSIPRRSDRSPHEIQSPGRRGKPDLRNAAPKSPSLRANIIVPPPKISPPLRSSRPRLPVSSASTAASRARMAEKFNEMQKINNEKRAASRQLARPPELTDVDLKARRLRITQALSRSLEGQDLRGNFDLKQRRALSSSGTISPSPSDQSQELDLNNTRNRLPTVLVDHDAAASESEREDFQTPEEGEMSNGQTLAHSAIHNMQVPDPGNRGDDDSPTLGHGESPLRNKPSPLQTDFLRIDLEYEPSSAVTVGTEYTTIDPEPQTGVEELHPHEDTLLSHIHRMRHQSSGLFQPDSPDRNSSDHDDQESVHLILRDTAYLEDSEAIRTGYRQAPAGANAVPSLPVPHRRDRDSWTSSAHEEGGQDAHYMNGTGLDSPTPNQGNRLEHRLSDYEGYSADKGDRESTLRSTMASDAYTIINIVLQQHSTGGVVDQQFVDDVYNRVLENPPYDARGSISTNKIEQLCLQELQNREDNWRKSIISSRSPPQRTEDSTGNVQNAEINDQNVVREHERSPLEPPPPLFRNHQYKSSLDSVEDWANTSPSVGDWMRFAVDENGNQVHGQAQLHNSSFSQLRAQHSHDITMPTTDAIDETSRKSESLTQKAGFDSGLLEPPKLPPIPPAKDTPPVIQTTFGTALVEPPQVPQRLTSASQVALSQPAASGLHTQGSSQGSKIPAEETDGPEQRQLKKRRHIIKELVDTEFSYEKDLKVLCDIYKQTAAAALADDDIKVLFGNVEQVQEYSRNFLMLLKVAAKPTYVMERPERKKEKQSENLGARRQSSSSTLASAKAVEHDVPSLETDRETSIGQAFEASLPNMERVYADYIRNRNAANQRLEVVQKSPTTREWLKECKDNSSDITNAWNLDALLVKPVQRITKYPLLLRELLESTPKDHPDVTSIQRALQEVTEVNVRINDVKKHTELVDQVLNRKRKDSDVRIGLSKAFGRRAEKLKQHLGTAEMYEDNEYNEIKINYDNNIVQLMVVGNDCSSYGRAITRWVNKMVEVATAGEAWIDVGPSNHQEAESKLRHFAMVTRGISTIALPDHLEQLESKVLIPMQSAVDLMNKLKNDPKGLLQKRDKRLIDYAQARNKRDRGEKIDKKMVERMEQWEALNTEAKQRMKKLILATAKLVQACQNNLIQMQMTWLKMVQTKLSAAMGFQLDKLDREDIEKEWQLDFDFQEASALALGICNGSLLAEAVNMVSFQTPSTTLNGDDSPRQHSFTSTQKRSISMHSNGSHVQITEVVPRTSGQYNRQPYDVLNDRSQFYMPSFSGTRDRASSSATVGQTRSPEILSRNGHAAKHSSMGGSLAGSIVRPENRLSSGAPRLSVETPSPFLGPLQPEVNYRPPSSSTFFSAAADIPTNARHQSTGSSIFSSAMPMSDSPVVERHSEPPARQPDVLFTAASVYEFNIDRSRQEAGFPYLTYVTGEIFDIIGERGELWLAKNQDDPQNQIGWIWNKHFAKLAE